MKALLPFGVSSPDEVPVYLRVERINMYPESAPDARSQTILRTAPGLVTVANKNGFNRGAHVMGEILYAVQGERLRSYDEDYVDSNHGAILGGARCVMADYFIPGTSRQLAIGTSERGYIYDTVTGLVEITDGNFTANAQKRTPLFIGGYAVWDTPDGMLWSDQQDFLTYPALNFRTAEAVPDGVLGLAKVFNDVWMLGGDSIEVHRLTGQADENAFAVAQVIDYGVASPYATANADNGFFFLEAKGRVYRASGFNPVRISTFQIEQWLRSVDLSDAFMLSFVDRGHEFVALTVPGSKTEVYDVATGIWSRRQSFDMERWRVNSHAFFQNENVFGDYDSGKLRKLDRTRIWEGDENYGSNDDELARHLYTTYIHEDTDPLFATGLELIAEVGVAYENGGVTEKLPVIEMQYSDDGGHNWSDWRQGSVGAIGRYWTRIRWDRMGMTRQRVFHLRMTDPVKCDLIALTFSGEKGVIA